MRSSRGKSTTNTPILAGLFALVLVVVAGAVWLLGDDTAVESTGRVVQVEDDAQEAPMTVPEGTAPEAPEPIAVPVALRSEPATEVFQPAAGTPCRALSGRVVDEQGTGVGNAELRMYKGNPLLLDVNFAGTRKLLDVAAVSAADGSFTFPCVPVGRDYVLVGEHPDFARTELAGLVVQPNRDLVDVTLRMEQGATVAGVVRTSGGGVPIAAARVELYDAIASVQLEPEERRPWKIVFTDNTGAYAFEHVSATSLKVRVLAEGYESQVRMLSFALDARASDRTVDFELKIGTSIPGVVVDTQGRPIEGVHVEATSLTKDYVGTATAYSDRRGEFILDGMGDEHFYQVRATRKGFSNKVLPKVHVDNGQIQIEMDQRLYVEGVVLDISDRPIRNYSLTLMRAAEGRDPLFLNDTRNFSASDGTFVFDNLDPGSYALEARAAGLAPSWSENFAVVRTDDPAPRVTIVMGRGGTLSGAIEDPTGKPVPNAVVKLNPNNHVDSPIQGIFSLLGNTTQRKVQTRTDGRGEFELANVRPGTYQLGVSHPEFAPTTVNDVLILDDDVGSNPPVTVSMRLGATIAGVALDANGRPITFCEVQITNKKTAYLDAATTDAQGRFEFHNLEEGTYTLMVKPDRIGSQAVGPLQKLMYAQRSQQEQFVSGGQQLTDVELYLPNLTEQN